MNTFPVLLGTLCVFALAYRYYSAIPATKVLALDDSRITPSHVYEDGPNYVPPPSGYSLAITSLPSPAPAPGLDLDSTLMVIFVTGVVLVLIECNRRCWKTLHGRPIPQEAFGPPEEQEEVKMACC